MSDFGDVDPEDGYDAADPPVERFRILLLWLASVALEQAREHDHARVLARIQSARWAAGTLRGTKLPLRKRMLLRSVRDWLDDLLGAEGTP